MAEAKKVLWKKAYSEFVIISREIENILKDADISTSYLEIDFIPNGEDDLVEIYTNLEELDVDSEEKREAITEALALVAGYMYKAYEVKLNYGYKYTDLRKEIAVGLENNCIIDISGEYVDVETFIDIVETQDTWDATDMESYEKAFDVIGFGYKSDDKYEDCDFEWIWDDFKKIALGLAIEEVQKMNKEEIEAWFDDHQIGVSKDSENLDYILEVCGYKVPYAVGEDIDKVAEVLEKYCESL